MRTFLRILADYAGIRLAENETHMRKGELFGGRTYMEATVRGK